MTQNAKKTGQVATVTLFGLFTRLVGFLFKIFSSRVLGAEAIGIFQIALSVFFLFNSVACSGIPIALHRRTAERGNKEDFSHFTTAFIWSTGIALALSVLLMMFGENLGFMFSDKNSLPVFLLMIPALLSSAMYCTVRGYLWGRKKFTAFSLTETGEETLRIILSVLFIVGVFGVFSGTESLSYAFVISDIVATAIILAVFFAKGGNVDKPAPSIDIVKPAFPITCMHLGSSLFGTLLAFMLPMLLQQYGLSIKESTACFGRICGMANPLLFASGTITGSICVVLMPDISRYAVKKEYDKLNMRLSSGIHFSVLVAGLFMAVYLATGSKLTEVIFGDKESGEYLKLAAFSIVPMTIAQMTQSVLNGIGKEKNGFINYLIGNVLLLLIVFVLTPIIGIKSVAIGAIIGNFVIFLGNYFVLAKMTKWGKSTFRYALYAYLFAGISAVFSGSFYALFEGMGKVVSLLLVLVITTLCYLSFCFLFGLVDVNGFAVKQGGMFEIVLSKLNGKKEKKKNCREHLT